MHVRAGREIPLLEKGGRTRHQWKYREATFERSGRGGAKRKPDRAQPQEKTGGIYRPNHLAELTTPSARNKVASRLLIDRAATPPFQGGESSFPAASRASQAYLIVIFSISHCEHAPLS